MSASTKRRWVVLAGCLLAGMMAACQQDRMPPRTAAGTQPATRAAAAVMMPQPPAQRLLDEPTRRVVKLGNGLTAILQQNKNAPVVACRVYIKAGSLTEQEFMGAGISHVLEHLVAGASSQKRQEEESQQALRILGGDSNAFTTFDQTCYFITTTAEKWPMAMELLADWTTGADFTKEQFDREYQVVQREIEMGEAEAARTFYKMTYANRYQVFPARHPVIGYKAAFQKLTWQDCRAYYQRMYVPDNMIVSVAGDIELDQAQQTVERDFGGMERKKVPAITLPEEPPVTAPRKVVGHADVREARVEWAFPTVDLYSPDLYAMDVLANVLGSGESSILVRRLRDEKGLVTGIEAVNDTPRWAPGAMEIAAQLPPGRIMAAQEELLGTLRAVAGQGVDPKDVEKAKTEVAAAMIYGNQTAEQQASRNAEDFLAAGNIDFSRLYVERIKQVTPEQVDEAARRYLRPEALLTTVMLPKQAPDSAAGVASATQSRQAKEPVQKMVLPNGLRVLINRNPSAPVVSMQLYTLGSLLAENEANNGVGSAMMQLMARGTTSRSHEQIAEFFDSTGGDLSTSVGNNAFIVQATCLKENAAKTFEVFADVILNPAFSGEELEKIRPQLLAAVDRSTEDWFGEGYKFLRANYYKDSPYARLSVGTREVVGKVAPEQIRQHYQKYFLDPSRTVVAIYGDIDPAQAQQWAQRFGQMPDNKPQLATVSVANGAKTVTAPTAKNSAGVFIGYGPGMVATSDDRFAMIILQTMLGGYNSPGGSVLHETLRGKGLVYVVQATNIAGPVPGMFMVMALGEPKNAPEIVQLIQQIIDDAKDGKFTDEQIATAKDQAITGEQLQDQTIAGQAADQAIDEMIGLGYDDRAHFADNIRKVTKEDIVRVARKYLQEPVVAITTPAAASASAK